MFTNPEAAHLQYMGADDPFTATDRLMSWAVISAVVVIFATGFMVGWAAKPDRFRDGAERGYADGYHAATDDFLEPHPN